MPATDQDMPPLGRSAGGQTDHEYATVILRLCNVREVWSVTPRGEWVSSVPNLRAELEAMVRLIKTRTVKNVDDHARMRRSGDTLAVYDAIHDNGCSICRDPHCDNPGGKH